MVREELNENDTKLLGFCFDARRSIAEISKFLDIAPSSVSVRVSKLEEMKLVLTETLGKGKEKYVRTIDGDNTKKYFIELLQELSKAGGSMSEEKFVSLLPFSFANPADRDKFQAPMKLMFTNLVKRNNTIEITEEGRKFLEENKRQ